MAGVGMIIILLSDQGPILGLNLLVVGRTIGGPHVPGRMVGVLVTRDHAPRRSRSYSRSPSPGGGKDYRRSPPPRENGRSPDDKRDRAPSRSPSPRGNGRSPSRSRSQSYSPR